MHFPVITGISVDDYALFPGTKAVPGLHFDFREGISAVIGINGLGKTTLLNMMYRALAGPRDWKRRDSGQATGSGQIALGGWRQRTYFRDRVPDAAAKASVTLDVTIGTHELTIVRSLRDLSLQEFTIDNEEASVDHKFYETEMSRLCGVGSFTDFVLILHYLLFFLEDRTPLLWDVDAQREVLRALLFPAEDANRVRLLFNDIQVVDSRMRNRRAHLAGLERELAELIGAPSVGTPDEDIGDLKAVGAGAHQRSQRADDALRRAGARLDESRLALERARLELTERQEAYAEAEASRLHQLLGHSPTAFGPAEFIGHALTGSGCLVCGSTDPAVHIRMLSRVRDNACPFCEAPPEEQELRLALTSPSKHRRLTNAHESLRHALDAVTGQLQEVEEAQRAYAAALDEAGAARDALHAAAAALEKHGSRLDADPIRVKQLQDGIAATRPIVESLAAELRIKAGKFAKLQRANLDRVSAISDDVVRRFHRYAQHFLAEDTALVYAVAQRRLGQSEHFAPVPRFQPQMTSAAQPTQRLAREHRYAVSESQREFLDLAFRMAVLSAVAPDSGVTLVLETPEASLDIVFTVRAGELLGEFAKSGDNRVIATSNLTSGQMVQALFGTARLPGTKRPKRPPHYVAKTQRARRLLDLLQVAAPNAALRKYGAAYRTALRTALTQDLR